MVWSCCYTEGWGGKCSEILATMKLLQYPRVNKVFTHYSLSHMVQVTEQEISVATYFYEIQSSSFSAPLEKIDIISVYSKGTGSHQFYRVCILLLIIFVLLYVGRICHRVYQLRSLFFKSFWNWMEIFQVFVSVLAVVMNLVRSAKAI